MWPAPLKIGDTIALVSPSHVAVREEYQKLIAGMEAKGFRVKEAPNLYKHAYGYSASEEERAEDFNRMVADEEVKMVFFGGGYGENEILPLIDFEAVKKHPKIYMSYSDGTTILDAIYARTGLVTYYGQSPGEFSEVTPYTWQNFESRIVKGESGVFVPNRALRGDADRRVSSEPRNAAGGRILSGGSEQAVHPLFRGSRGVQ